jgi:YggT family protein
MALFGQLLYMVLEIYTFIIIGSVIVSWLIAFNVISMQHPAARNLVRFLARVTDPIMTPIRRFIPPIGGIDITPIIAIFALMALQTLVIRVLIAPSLY